MICPSCGANVTAGRFCPACGTALSPTPSDAETRLTGSSAGSAGTAGAMASPGPALGHGRFAPGTILEGRYRVVSLLGRGGMGEVYRADDLRLDQPVALKFLPESLEMDPARLARFHGEVRTARQVSHPNVCRVYDIGEAGGRHFLSMEYIDGEDLASLLRRIGRLPSDKGVEIARQLCAGLAAAHDRGVLHRDLKPANVMIDGAGRVRLTDFGIAGAAETGADVRAGTPAYMAPEQLAGQEVSTRSDVYSLGLVLYEIFTGRRAFDAATVGDLLRQHERGAPPTPTSAVPDLHPATERTIMRCLETDPALRPPSAIAVAAGLPGASPLEAALAAGETPSPEMVAAAGTSGVLSRGRALGLVAGCGASLLLLAALADQTTVVSRVPPFKDTAILIDRAEQIVTKLGYPPGVDRTFGFSEDQDYLRHVASTDRSADRWQRVSVGAPPAITFWYRASPRELLSWQVANETLFDDPPAEHSDMVRLRLDAAGRLVYFDAVPPQVSRIGVAGSGADPAGSSGVPDASGARVGQPDAWAALFQEAGLDRQAFTQISESWTPPSYADSRAAWVGTIGAPAEKVRIEAAAYTGRPVYFAIIGPWTRPARQQQAPDRYRWLGYVSLVLLLASLLAAALMARRNVREGRGDRRGAIRLAAFLFAIQTIEYLLGAHHMPHLGMEWTQFVRAASISLFMAAMIWLLYLALEPAARRLWPNLLIAWSRLLTGRVKDPMLGRDLLVGLLAGLGSVVILRLHSLQAMLRGHPEADLDSVRLQSLLGLRHALGSILTQPDEGVLTGLVILMLLVGSRLVLRRVWLAFLLTAAVLALLFLQAIGWIDLLAVAVGLACSALLVFVLVRYGLLAAVVTIAALNLSASFPLTLKAGAWYFDTALVGYGAFVAMALWGFRLAQKRAAPA